MTAALVRHIVNQGVYRPEDIAVLTPYLGQLQHLRKALGNAFAIVLNDRDVADLENADIKDTLEDGKLYTGVAIFHSYTVYCGILSPFWHKVSELY